MPLVSQRHPNHKYRLLGFLTKVFIGDLLTLFQQQGIGNADNKATVYNTVVNRLTTEDTIYWQTTFTIVIGTRWLDKYMANGSLQLRGID